MPCLVSISLGLFPLALTGKVEGELERLQKEGIIELVKFSEWAAPIVPVVKTNGQIRLCGDYRLTVNQASKLEAYPLPKIGELFARMARENIFKAGFKTCLPATSVRKKLQNP